MSNARAKSKWPDFLFTVGVRFICGMAFGALVCLLFTWRGIMAAFTHSYINAPLIWLVVCGLMGGIIAVFTVPYWQRPWYKRDPESVVFNKSVSIKIIGEDGQQHEYSSFAEVPLELRSKLRGLMSEAAQQEGKVTTSAETIRSRHSVTYKAERVKVVSLYKIIDDHGVERTYNSVEEMPPEIRAAFEVGKNDRKGSQA